MQRHPREGVGVLDLELRSIEGRSRESVIWRKVAEDTRRHIVRLTEVREPEIKAPVIDTYPGELRAGVTLQSTHHTCPPKDRLLQLAGVLVGRPTGVIRACLGVQQDGAYNRLEIAARACSIVNKDACDAAHVLRAGVALDQALDEPPADKRWHGRVVEDIRQRRVDVRIGALAGRQSLTAQERLRIRVMVLFQRHHGATLPWRIRPPVMQLLTRGAAIVIGKGKSGICPCKILNNIRRVVGNRVAISIPNSGAVLIQLDRTNAEQLHQFAAEILIRVAAVGRRAAVGRVQIRAHRGRVRDVRHQVLPIAECVVREGVEVVRHVTAIHAALGDHKDLAEGKCDALPQLVRGIHRLLPPPCLGIAAPE